MWDPQLCGAIEQPDASLSLRISRGNGNVADETVTVRNTGGTTVDLTAGCSATPGGTRSRRIGSHTGRLPHRSHRQGRDRRPRVDVYRDREKELYVDLGTELDLVGDGAYLLEVPGTIDRGANSCTARARRR